MSKEKVQTVPRCPQCGGNNFKENWVSRPAITKRSEVTLDEWATTRINQRKHLPYLTGDVCFIPKFDYSQLVLSCEDCGYTKVYEVEKHA